MSDAGSKNTSVTSIRHVENPITWPLGSLCVPSPTWPRMIQKDPGPSVDPDIREARTSPDTHTQCPGQPQKQQHWTSDLLSHPGLWRHLSSGWVLTLLMSFKDDQGGGPPWECAHMLTWAPCSEELGVTARVALRPRERTCYAADWGDSGSPLLRANGFPELYGGCQGKENTFYPKLWMYFINLISV